MVTEQSRQARCIDSLRLSAAEQAEILQALAEREQAADRSNRRREERRPFQRRFEATIHAPHGPVACYGVVGRNLTSRGIGFLHGTFMYSNVVCTVGLPALDGRIIPVRGRTVRCQLIRRHIHDIGVRFDKRIALAEFVEGVDDPPETDDAPVSDTPADAPLFSDLWTELALRPIVRSFVPALREQVLEAGRLMARDQCGPVFHKLCLDIKGAAAGYGYPRVSAMAGQLLELTLAGQDRAWQKQIMAELIELGRAAARAIDDAPEA